MPSYDQGFQTGSKQGTRFLGEGSSWSELAVDLSQYGEDMVDMGDFISESPSPRYDIAAPRTIHARLEVTSGGGYLYSQDNASTGPTALLLSAGLLEAVENGDGIGLTLQLGVGMTARTYDVAWVTEANPDATGDDDAVVSWLLAYDVDNDTPYRAGPVAHAARATDATSIATWGADRNGDDAYPDPIARVSYHDRAWTLAEIYDTWISSTAAPSGEATIEREALPLTVDSGIGDRSERQGPPGAWAARSLRQLRRRTATGRSIALEPVTLTSSSHVNNPFTRLAMGSLAYRWRLGWLWAVPVPPTVSHFYVRVHADLWVDAGHAVPTGLRVYCSNRPLVLAEPDGAEPYEQAFVEQIVARDDGEPGEGAWTLDGLLPIRRGTAGLRRGWAYVSLAYAIDPAGATDNADNARLRVNAIQLAPCHVEPEPGGPVEGGEAG